MGEQILFGVETGEDSSENDSKSFHQYLCFNKRDFTECNGQKIEEETYITGC